MEVLIVTPEVPYPTLGGGAQRVASLVEYFAARGDTVDVLAFERGEAPKELVRRVFTIPLPANGRGLPHRVLRNAGRLARGVPPLIDRLAGFDRQIRTALEGSHYDIILVEHFWLAPYVDLLQQFGRVVICDLHNIESRFFTSLADSSTAFEALAHSRFARLNARLEGQLLPKFDLCLTTSQKDAEHVQGLAQRVAVYPNTIPWRPVESGAREPVVVFSANLEYHPNQQAVRWFNAAIWPQLRIAFPRLRWRLVGMNPQFVADTIKGDSRVECSGAVADTMPEIARASVAVAPLLSGSGTRIKILEAWAAGTPVVSTTLGCEGLPVSDGDELLVADEAVTFATAVTDVLNTPVLAAQLSRAGRVLYEREFHREAGWRKLDTALGPLCG